MRQNLPEAAGIWAGIGGRVLKPSERLS